MQFWRGGEFLAGEGLPWVSGSQGPLRIHKRLSSPKAPKKAHRVGRREDRRARVVGLEVGVEARDLGQLGEERQAAALERLRFWLGCVG